MREIAAQLDPRKTQLLSLDQFLTACYYVRDRKPDKNEIYNALKIFDSAKTGYVNVADVRSVVTSIGDLVTGIEFETVFAEIEVNQKG